MNDLEQLLYLRGVSAEYFNYVGERTIIPLDLRLAFLTVSGYDISNQSEIRQAIYELDAEQWQSWLKPFNVITLGTCEFIDIKVHPDEKLDLLNWRIFNADKEVLQGQFIADELQEVGEYYIASTRYSAHRLNIESLAIGYYQFEVSNGAECATSSSVKPRIETADLIISPQACYDGLQQSNKSVQDDSLIGISCQIYTLRSDRNWGIGDFTDLLNLVKYSSRAKMDLIGLNPLHSPDIAGEDIASPYSSSDRRFLNPLYIDPERVDEYKNDKTSQAIVNQPSFQKQLADLRETNLVDYDSVAKIKFPVFNHLYKYFLEEELNKDTLQAKRFKAFVFNQGKALADYSNYQSHFSGLSVSAAKDPVFHQYLQWLCHQQLDRCQQVAIDNGMSIGLMGDLALGAIKTGAEVGGNPELFCNKASIGAPPDEFTKEGQNWSLPALDPIGLRKNKYQHFIQLLRANMSYCGALRIDHVMSLLRLWWCLPEHSAGAYVYYPMDDLFAILTLESHLNQCVVIGEDMGVVPDELRNKMAESNVYSNKTLYFERYHNREFKLTKDHQKNALLMVTSHDVSTLAGWWNKRDIDIKKEINLITCNEEYDAETNQRDIDKKRLLEWLSLENQLPNSWQLTLSKSPLDKTFDFDLCSAILTSCTQSNSQIMLFQLEDLQLIEEPVNIPGTYQEYPNWRRKQKLSTDDIFSDRKINTLLNNLLQQRKQ